MSAVVLVTTVGVAEGARPAAAALACAGAGVDRAALLIDVGGRPPRPTLLASAAARALEERLAAHLPSVRLAARGQVCHLSVAADADGFASAAAAATVAHGSLVAVHLAPALVQPLFGERLGVRLTGALLRAEVGEDRPLLALAYADLRGRGLAVAVLKRRLAWVAERRALFGTLPPGDQGALPRRLLGRLLPPGPSDAGTDMAGATGRAAPVRSAAELRVPAAVREDR